MLTVSGSNEVNVESGAPVRMTTFVARTFLVITQQKLFSIIPYRDILTKKVVEIIALNHRFGPN
jgi:hypothetical protein